MKKLFAIYIGGAHEKSLIELHDMCFVIGENIEDTYAELKKQWWGKPDSLHIDAWGCLHYADGYKIVIKNYPATDTQNKLYFVNLGGYDDQEFTELHKNVFVVAETDSKAKVKALKQILDWKSFHKDYQFEIDKIISIQNLVNTQDHFIHLVPSPEPIPFEFTCKYTPIGHTL